MKLLTFSVLALLLILTSCTQEPAPAETIIETIQAEIPEEDNFNYDTLTGIYMSDFGGSDIRIVLNYVSRNNAIGYNIHKGLQRNINGPVRVSGDSIYMTLNEPGDHEYDGAFELAFVGIDSKPTGEWTCNNGLIGKKSLSLKKQLSNRGDSEEISTSNFTQNFGWMYDSIGNYNFQEDGLCIYDYYPTTDDKSRVEQLIEIKGTWSFNDDEVKIDWQQNSMFPPGPMILKINREEYGEPFLKNDDRTIHNHFW